MARDSTRFAAAPGQAGGIGPASSVPQLRDVRSLIGRRVVVVDDATLEFTSLELWSAFAVVRYSYRHAHRSRLRSRRLEWSARDDAGTVYRVGTTNRSPEATWGLIFGDRVIEPAPPRAATLLKLVATDGETRASIEFRL